MNKELAKTIGAATRSRRESLHLNQAEAAERLGVSVEFYARIEHGMLLPSILTFARIVSVLKVNANTLLGRPVTEVDNGANWAPASSTGIERVLRTQISDLQKRLAEAQKVPAEVLSGDHVNGCPVGACDHSADEHGAIFNQLCDVEGCPCGESSAMDSRARDLRAGGLDWKESQDSGRKA